MNTKMVDDNTEKILENNKYESFQKLPKIDKIISYAFEDLRKTNHILYNKNRKSKYPLKKYITEPSECTSPEQDYYSK